MNKTIKSKTVFLTGFVCLAILSANGQSLADAVDAPQLTWTTGGNQPWVGQTTVAHDGTDAARSGLVGHNQQSWLQTTVTGPGTLTFWWKVSSEEEYDFLEFFVNGVLQDGGISGEVDWQHQTFDLGSGSKTLLWRYMKDSSENSGGDRGWVDLVGFGPPSGPPIIATQPQSQTLVEGSIATFSVIASGARPLSYQWHKGVTVLVNATNSSFSIANVQTNDSGSYSVAVANTNASVNSASAALTVLRGTNGGPFPNPTPMSGDEFGSAFAALGKDRVLIGAPGDGGRGAAYLFSASHALLTTFHNPTPTSGDAFGSSVALGNDRVLIGAPYDNTGAVDAGAAYLFSVEGALLITFTNPTPHEFENFGIAVAAVGTDRVLVGTWQDDDTSVYSAGAAYLFSTNGTLLTNFINPTPESGDGFGQAVAAVGNDRVLISAPRDNTTGEVDVGVAYLFTTNGVLVTTFTNPTPASSDAFGYSVAAVGSDRVLVGTPFDSTGGISAGVAYLFSINGTLLTTFTNPSPASQAYFGSAVAGVGNDRVLIGSHRARQSPFAGKAYLFSTGGILLTNFTDPNPAAGGEFGSSVAVMGGDAVIIGAPQADGVGAAYFFELDGPPTTDQFSNPGYSPVTGFSFTFLGATVGQPYRIQTSPSLALGSWTDFTNFTYTVPVVITDPSAVSGTNRYFRAVTP